MKTEEGIKAMVKSLEECVRLHRASWRPLDAAYAQLSLQTLEWVLENNPSPATWIKVK